MKNILILGGVFLLIILMIGAECTPTLPIITPTPGNVTPIITPSPTLTPSVTYVFEVTGYEDSFGENPVKDGYVNKVEMENGFKVIGTAPSEERVEMALKLATSSSEVLVGSVTSDDTGHWEIEVNKTKWGEDGLYSMIFRDEKGETIIKIVRLDTKPPTIRDSDGYIKTIISYGFTITEEADHITARVIAPSLLTTDSWEVYVKVGSDVIIKRSGILFDTTAFNPTEDMVIRSVPGVTIEIDKNILYDETLRFETVAPTWENGLFRIFFDEPVKKTSISPSSTGDTLIAISSDTTGGPLIYLVNDANAIFPESSESTTNMVFYLSETEISEDLAGKNYYITLSNIEDEAGNKVEVRSEGTMATYGVWFR